MTNAWLDTITTWITAHPVAAGGVIFLIAFCDALAVVGIVVPALPLLFAVGTLIGLGHIDGPYALTCAALGAFFGDALSYWLGHRWGPSMREHWLFRRYPQLIDRGERMFRKHGSKGIVIARFVGAVRPFVPAVAGMLRLPLRQYVPASMVAAVLWAACFLAPGWMFGASYDAVAAVADRLALVLLALVVVNRLIRMPIGRAWEALREDEIACRALGLNPTGIKLSAFTIGAAFAGFAGSFFAARQGLVTPESFTFIESAMILAIVVLGGMGSQLGVIAAAAVMVLLQEMRDFAEYRMLVFGFTMIVMMIWRPQGLLPMQRPHLELEQ